jgi:hypothetical protein
MIKLKNGKIVEFDQDFDQFFQLLMSEIISESMKTVSNDFKPAQGKNDYNRLLLKEIMDNSIYITHQIFELSELNANLSRFLVTGFLFNSIVLSIPSLSGELIDEARKEDIVH